MEEPDAAACGTEDHGAAARLERADSVGYGGPFMAAAPGVGDDGMACGAQGCLTEEDEEKETEKQGGFAVELVQSLEAIFAPFDGSSQIGEKRGSHLEGMSESAEFGNLRTCHVANGVLEDKSLCVTCGEAFCSEDGSCTCDILCKREDLAGNRGDLQMFSEEAHCDSEVLSDSIKHDEKQWSRAVDGMEFVSDINNEMKQNDLMPKIEADVSRPACEDSVPSISGRIHVSLDGKACGVGELPSDSMTCHVAAGGMGNKGLFTTFGEYDTVDKATKASQCEQSVSVGEASVLWDGLEVKAGLENLQMCCSEPHCDNEGLSDLGKHDIDKLPRGADDLILMTDTNHELQKQVFLPNIDSDISRALDEPSIPFIYENPTDVPLDGRGVGVGEKLKNRTCLEKVACDFLGGDILSYEPGFQTDAPEDDNQHSWIKVSKGSASSVCTEANIEGLKACDTRTEVEVPQQNDKNYGTSESPPKRDLINSSHNLACKDEPCCSDREFVVLCPGHQVSGNARSGCSEHRVQEPEANSAVDKPCFVDFLKNGYDGELQNQKSAPLVVFRRKNPRRAASSRNTNNHDRPIKASSCAHRSKRVGRSISSLQSTMIKFPNKTTKGRSARPLKCSSWGSLQKVIDGFGQNCGPLTSNSDLNFLGKGGSNGRSDEKMQPSIRRNRNSRCSKGKCVAFSDIGYALGELNWQHTFSVTTDANASSEDNLGNVPKSSHALINDSGDIHKSTQCIEGDDKLKLMAVETDRQELGSVLESITQETCPTYIQRDCAISTSELSLKSADIGFSPDSVLEVACVTCENSISASHEGLEQQAETVRGNENTRMEDISPVHSILDNDIHEGKVHAIKKSNTERKNKKMVKQKVQKKDGTARKNMKNRSSTKISSSEVSKLRVASNGSSSLDPSDALLPAGPPKFDSSSEGLTSVIQHLNTHERDSMQGPSVTDNKKSLGHNKKDGQRGKKGEVQDPHVKGKSKKKYMADGISVDHGPLSSQLSTDQVASHMNGKGNLSPASEVAFKSSVATSAELPRNFACKTEEASLRPRLPAAWVCCDDCQKWRCIPAELADIIRESRWTCKDNRDKVFADCSIPQEKSNAEINAELDLSDASADEADNDGSNLKASRAPSWTHIRSNLFLHRSRRTQSIDESMVCNCKPPQDGRMGCRDGCLNRMLNIECVKRTCPCGDQCSNQKFQRRSYAKLNWFQSGKKGYGLQLQEDVSEGRFLIEYVGEVLDITAYESRQRSYASKGQKHFYFMALNGGEVIDACTKGNLGRFINHSCSPNCCTEKWIVNGEVCIGIFALRNIRKGEELTFDYNYVRVSGAAAQKCFCGTSECRGYIGGDISGAGIISQDDAEVEHLEPMVADKDANEMLCTNGFRSHDSDSDIVEHKTSIQREYLNDCPSSTPELELQQTAATIFDSSEPENSLETLSPQYAEDVIRTPVHVSRTTDSSWQLEYLHKTSNTKDVSETPNVMNGSVPSSDLGSNLVPVFQANKKNIQKHHRNVKPSSSPIDRKYISEVEGELNELLDVDGGINKCKNSANGYLKLLAMTAAGDDAGGTSNSIRDLALILDALLKTKSHAVLFDVISKNGFQMLHIILKQSLNRKDMIRRPIIRKLLKILEFLASEDILKSKQINGVPRCAGTESFRDLILSLTRHKDTQVHQIARNFRDRWIPRNLTRNEPTEYPHIPTSAQDIQGSTTAGGLVSTSNNSTDRNFTRRKRKSCWDYQPDDHYKMVGLKIQKVCSGLSELDPQTGLMRERLQGNWGANSCPNNAPTMGSLSEGEDDEAPPGFESQKEYQPAQALVLGVAPGICLERYQHNLSISYGIPATLVEHLGTPEGEGGQCRQKWKIAPGVPFNPFPPLPPYPRGSPCPSTSSTQMSQQSGALDVKHNTPGYCGRSMNRDGRVHRNWQNGTRAHGPYNHQGRRFPSNHRRFERCRPPRPLGHGDSGFGGRE